MTSKINFEELKALISVVDVAAWLGVKLKQTGNTYRGDCPLCDQERSFTLTPDRGLWGCFKCQKRGSIIDMVATFRNVGLHQAGVMLHRQFLDGGTVNSAASAEDSPVSSTQKRSHEGKTETRPPNSSPPNVDADLATKLAKVQERLLFENEAVQALGLTPDVARAFSIGYCGSGIMRGRICFPLFLDGQLVAFTGLATTAEMSPLMLFPNNLAEVIAPPKQEVAKQDDVPSFLRAAK